jgi:arylsulfatase A-like enzyme
MGRRKLLTTAATAVAVVVVLVIAVPHLVRKRPDVILISIDTLRPDHLGCYGYEKPTSPGLDTFAQDAILFERCFSQAPTTRPSCGAILTGYYPHELKIFSNRDNLPVEVEAVAEHLKRAGYTTIGVVSNFVLRKGGGFEQGFHVFDDRMDDRELVRRIPERIADKTTDTAVGLLKLHHGRKLFMWVHYQDPHGPYTPPGRYGRMFDNPGGKSRVLEFNSSVSGKGGIPSYQKLGDRDDYDYYVSQYDGEIRFFDEHFKRLIRALKDLDLYDNSLIIITSDHGEGMGEHDYFFAHGEYVYNSLIHVPLIVRYGDRTMGERRRELVQLIDIVPTILETVGLEAAPDLRGDNLLKQTQEEKLIFSEMPGKYSFMVHGLKLIHHVEEDEYMLFDVRKDRLEKSDLITDAEYADITDHLKTRLAGVREENLLGSSVTRKTPALTEEEKEKLKSLGYVQ